MTLADRFGGSAHGVDLALAIVVEGIPYCFVDRDLDAGALTKFAWCTTGRTVLQCLDTVRHGEIAIDVARRRMIDPTLELELVDYEGSLLALFAPNTRRSTWMGENTTAADTTLTLGDATVLPSSGHVYVGAETIKYTGTTPTTITGCTRGYLDSRAQRRRGGADDGESVYTVPPSWLGRRVSLYGLALEPSYRTAALRVDDGNAQLLWTFRVDSPPRYLGESRWALRAGGCCEDYAKRRLVVDKHPVATDPTDETGGVPIYDDASDTWSIAIDDPSHFAASSTWRQYALLRGSRRSDGDDGVACVPIVDVDLVFKTLSFLLDDSLIESAGDDNYAPGLTVRTAEHIALVTGTSGADLLWALHSELGDLGADGVYDVLPGYERADFDDRYWRLGAALHDDEVDDDAFTAVSSLVPWTIVLHKPTTVGEILAEFCAVSNCWWGQDAQGRLTVQSLDPFRADASKTIDAGMVLIDSDPSVVFDESLISPIVKVSTNYDVLDGRFTVEQTFVDYELLQRYTKRTDAIEMKLKTVTVDASSLAPPLARGGQRWVSPTRCTIGDMEALVRTAMRTHARQRVLLSLHLGADGLALAPGELVDLATELGALIPDGEGAHAIGTRKARVVSLRPDYDDGTALVTLEVFDRLLHVASGAVIAGAAGAVMTLATTGVEVRSATPGDDFGVGWAVRIYDVSSLSGGSPTVDFRTIASATTTTITLSSAPSFAVQAGVDYVVADPATVGGAASASGYEITEQAYMEDSRLAPNGNRWR